MKDDLRPSDSSSRGFASRLSRVFDQVFSIDLRSLAVFRAALGSVLLGDFLVRIRHLEAHYTDAGILPVDMLESLYGMPLLSIHALSGSAQWEALLFGIAMLAAACLIVGYRTRAATVVSWLLLLSLHIRNPYILNSGDQYLLNLLLWSTLLPLGARWSLDARRTGATLPGDRILSIATIGILIQVCALYLISVTYKVDDAWISDFTAIYYALNIDAHATALGETLATAPLSILKLFTISTLAIEGFLPIVALSPFQTARCRMAAIVTFIAFHAGLALVLELGIFSIISAVAWLIFLPSEFWVFMERSATRLRTSTRSATPARSWSFTSPYAHSSTAGTIAAGLLLFGLSAAAVMGIGRHFGRSDILGEPLRVVRFTQHWSMFAPAPTMDRWYALTGYRQDEVPVNVFDPEAPTVSIKPGLVSSTYQGERWRKYLYQYYHRRSWHTYRNALPAYLWERWHRMNPNDPLDRIEVRVTHEFTGMPGESPQREDELLFTYRGSDDVIGAYTSSR